MTAMTTLPATLAMSGKIPGIDLHMHSKASDGALSPTELMHLCLERGLGRVALTDHDTVNGVAEARQAADELGIGLLPAAELSTQWTNIGVHVVAMMPEGEQSIMQDEHNPLRQMLDTLWEARSTRAYTIAERLERKGLTNALERARACAGGRLAIGRPHFAAALVEAGMVADIKMAFKRYLGAGKVGDVRLHWPEFSDVVRAIVAGGGIAVLAHPLRYELTRRRLVLLLDEFMAAGGEAVELCNGHQNDDSTRDLARLLEERQLYASVGSDFHKPGGPLAPGTFSALPRCRVAPIWTHPRLVPWIDATEASTQHIITQRQALEASYAAHQHDSTKEGDA